MNTNTQHTATEYIVRSAINKSLILCTNGEFHAECFMGPGTQLCAKVYKTRRNAEKVRGGYQIIVEETTNDGA
jgi:hypothetical protein